jgi:hypothetical protein
VRRVAAVSDPSGRVGGRPTIGVVVTVLRFTRLAVAVLIVAALVAQFRWSSDNRPTFTAGNFFSYFTVQSNILLAVSFVALVVRPALAKHVPFLALRGISTLNIIVTGLVYALLLAPSSADVDVTLQWVDVVLHTLAPIAGLADWLVDPPRRRIPLRTVAIWLSYAVVWLGYTMIRGAATEWYPYPFLGPDEESVGSIVVTCLAITAVFVVLSAGLCWWSARRAPDAGRLLAEFSP